jgi:hypothetical protein
MEYFRSIFGIIFSPFTAKFNHYIGLRDFENLKTNFVKVLVITLLLIVFPILSVSTTIKHFIFTWVGPQYVDSVPIACVLVMGYMFSFITSPSGILVMAFEKARMLYFTNTLLPVVYWAGVAITFHYWGLQSFANFKFFSLVIVAISYLIIIVKLLKLDFWRFLWKLLSPGLLPVGFILLASYTTADYLPLQKTKLNLIIYLLYNGLVVVIAILIYYYISSVFKENLNKIISTVSGKITKSVVPGKNTGVYE